MILTVPITQLTILKKGLPTSKMKVVNQKRNTHSKEVSFYQLKTVETSVIIAETLIFVTFSVTGLDFL